jgi:CRP-like cAMP-binding protein
MAMAHSIPMASRRPEYPTNIVNKYAGNRLLAAFPEKVLALLEPDLRQVSLRQGAVCYGAGDSINEVYFPQTGMISLLVTAKWSRQVRSDARVLSAYNAVTVRVDRLRAL